MTVQNEVRVHRRSWIATAALSLGASLVQKDVFSGAEAKVLARSENGMILLHVTWP